jgi:hypothetical protein
VPEWKTAFPHADVYLAPRILDQAKGYIACANFPLDRDRGYPWDAEIATLPIEGSYMTDVVFFHRPSRTLVLTDLIENFESEMLGSWLMRWVTKIGGVQDLHGRCRGICDSPMPSRRRS